MINKLILWCLFLDFVLPRADPEKTVELDVLEEDERGQVEEPSSSRSQDDTSTRPAKAENLGGKPEPWNELTDEKKNEITQHVLDKITAVAESRGSTAATLLEFMMAR